MLLFLSRRTFNAILDYWNSGRNVNNDTHEWQAQESNAQLTRLFGLKKEGANHLTLPRPHYCTEHYSIPVCKRSSWSARAKNAAYLCPRIGFWPRFGLGPVDDL